MTLVFAVTKFREGAWVVLLLIPALVAIFFAIHRHYLDMAGRLSLEDFGAPPRICAAPRDPAHQRRAPGDRGRAALRARPLRRRHRRHVSTGRRLRRKRCGTSGDSGGAACGWWSWIRRTGCSWSRCSEYIKDMIADQRQPNEIITIVVPQFVPRKRWHNLLHAQTAVLLRLALLFRPGIVITNVPYQVALDGDGEEV